MNNDEQMKFFSEHKNQGTEMKVFLGNKVMLEGRITAFDDVCVVLNECLIMVDKIISITPR